jgi:hypothetical protein
MANHTPYSSKRNEEHLPFLRLPAKLRNRIYELILGGQEICSIARNKLARGTYPFAIKLRPHFREQQHP